MKIASFNRFELELPDEAIEACTHSGDCMPELEHWSKIVKRPETLTDDMIRAELRECGAWYIGDLKDNAANWLRLVWIACGNVKDEEYYHERN